MNELQIRRVIDKLSVENAWVNRGKFTFQYLATPHKAEPGTREYDMEKADHPSSVRVYHDIDRSQKQYIRVILDMGDYRSPWSHKVYNKQLPELATKKIAKWMKLF